MPVTAALLFTLPANTLPENAPVAAATALVIVALLPFRLPLAVIVTPVTAALLFTLPASTLPVALTVVAESTPLPDSVKLLPVALPILGVTKVALATI